MYGWFTDGLWCGAIRKDLCRTGKPPRVPSRNNEAPHLPLAYYDDEAGDLDGAPSRYQRSLNGRWRFRWAPNPAPAPLGFEGADYDASDRDEISVPSNWQLRGYGLPMYINIR